MLSKHLNFGEAAHLPWHAAESTIEFINSKKNAKKTHPYNI